MPPTWTIGVGAFPFSLARCWRPACGLPVPRWRRSPDFKRQQAGGTVPSNPLRYTLSNHRVGILRSFAISALGSITYYVGITYVPAFLTSAGALSESESLRLSTVAAVAVILVNSIDRRVIRPASGRKPVLIFLAGCSAVLPIVMFSLIAGSAHLYALLGVVILACVAGACVECGGGGCDGRTVSGRGSDQRPGPGGDHGYRHLRGCHPIRCPDPHRSNRFLPDSRHHDRGRGRVRPSNFCSRFPETLPGKGAAVKPLSGG